MKITVFALVGLSMAFPDEGVLAARQSANGKLAAMVLADPATMLQSAKRIDFIGANGFSIENGPHGMCLRSTPHRSASGLFQPVNVTAKALRDVRWSWRVDEIHASADVTKRSREDFGAMIAFIFGHPSMWDRDVPSMAYVWTSTPVSNGAIIASPRFAKTRFIQLHGSRDSGVWHSEQRNIIADFMAAFGYPPGPLRYIAIFNDNDQTGEPASAVFAPISCWKAR